MDTKRISATVRHTDLESGQPAGQHGGSLFLRRDLSEQALRRPAEPQFDLSQVVQSRQQGYESGRLAGLAEANASISANQARATTAIAAAMAGADVQAARVADAAAAALAAALVAAMRAVMPDLIRRSGLREAGAMLAHVLPGLARQPYVDIEVPSAMADGVAGIVQPGGAGRIAVRGSDAMEPGGVRVSWSVGEATRQPHEIWQAVMAVIDPTLGQPEVKETANV